MRLGSGLPAFYTEDIISGDQEESNRRDFFDLFHHRYIAAIFGLAAGFPLAMLALMLAAWSNFPG